MRALNSGAKMTAAVLLALFANGAIGQSSSATSSTARDGGGSGTAPPAASTPAQRAAGTDSATKPSTAAAGKAVSAADKKMMMELAQANIAEIETGKLAERQTKNPDVLAFAKKMIEDHTQAANELGQLAQSKGVTLPEKPDSKHQALAARLGKLSGPQFDKQYMATVGVADHRKIIALLKKIQSSGTDPDLKALAGKLQPIVEQHLTMAQPKRGQ